MATRRNLFGITYLVEKRKFKLLFQGPLAKLGYNPTFYPILITGVITLLVAIFVCQRENS